MNNKISINDRNPGFKFRNNSLTQVYDVAHHVNIFHVFFFANKSFCGAMSR